MRARLFNLKSLFSLIALLIIAGGDTPAAERLQKKNIHSAKSLERMVIPGTRDLQLIIELSEPALVERIRKDESYRSAENARLPRERNRRVDFARPEVPAHREKIRLSQETLKKKISDFPDAQILGTTGTIMNTVIVRVPVSRYLDMKNLPGIKKIYFSRPRKMLLDQAIAVENVQALWTAAGGQSQTGRGIKIGVIDTGIDNTSPMFAGAGLSAPAGYPKYSSLEDRDLTNSKIIVARSYVSLLANPQIEATAMDEVGHGTFVASCAAGEHVTAPMTSLSGVAPGAYLGNYKIIGTPGINDATTSAAEISAIDDAVADGMDVINMSIGSLDYLPPEENPEYEAINSAIAAGVVVVIAAGNDGPNGHTIGSPGDIPDVITVGSVTGSREFLASIHTTNPNASVIGYLSADDGTKVEADMLYYPVVDVASLDDNGLACDPFTSGSLSGKIALIQRGTCTFAVKVANAQQAGAQAAILYNNAPVGLITMTGLGSTTIPAVMISNTDGVTLKAYVNANPSTAQAKIQRYDNLEAVTTTPRIISSFSSVGPAADFGIKPDLVAVGENVYAATETVSATGMMYDASGFTVSQGTSFAAPMVAGAAAGLIQRHPELGAMAIKSLLTTSASGNLTVDGTNPPSVLQAGNGLLNLSNAVAARALFSPMQLNFGVHSYRDSLSLSATLNIENISSESDQFTLAIAPVVDGPELTLSSNSVNLGAGASTGITVSIHAAAPATGGFQGYITVQSASTGLQYRIPYWAGLYVPDSGRILTVSQTGGGYSTLAAAVSAAQPGNIIEIQDDGPYSPGDTGLWITTNAQGLPLHGLTIRAAAGRKPIIDVADYSTGISIVGLQNVLLQGLDIAGGYTGIQLLQPTPIHPLSITIDNCTIRDSWGDEYAAGIWSYGGGTIDVLHSQLQNSWGAGIVTGLLSSGTQLTIIGSDITGNEYDGVDALNTNVHISKSNISNNYGSGIYLYNATGAVSGNTISNNMDGYELGSGIYIFDDGELTIKNNIIESNDSFGAMLYSSFGAGPAARVIGNTIRSNNWCGIYASPAKSLLADSNFLDSNWCGVALEYTTDAVLTNNIIARSTDAYLGHGLWINFGSDARVVNNTIYGNRMNGVYLVDGNVSIANSIIQGNAGENLSGVPSGSVQFSLTSVSVDPGLTNPNAGDYSPMAGSPAIDAGSNSATKLPFLDYYGRLRVASLSGLPGQGTVDIGAVEANSAYPLVYPLTVNGDNNAIPGTFRTGIAFSNPSSSTAHSFFTGYTREGVAFAGTHNPSAITLDPQGQKATLDYELFGFDPNNSSIGSVLGSSDLESAGFFLVFDKFFRQFSTGANASTPNTDLYFMRHQSNTQGMANYVISNPGVHAASIRATLYNSTGSSTGQVKDETVAPRGSAVLRFDSSELSAGYVRVTSNRPVSGVELVGNENLVAALSAFSPETHSRLFFPHFAVGGNYSTQIGIINTSTRSILLTLKAYDDSGKYIASVDSTVLSPRGQLLRKVSELFGIDEEGPLRTGYIVAESSRPGIMGFTDFSYTRDGRNADAMIPADSNTSQRLIFSHIAHGVNAGAGVYQTGIALLNPFGMTIPFTISVYNGAGTLVGQSQQSIGPHEKVAKILTYPVEGVAFFSDNLVLGNGHVEITTEYGLIGLELFFTEDVSQLASVPAQIRD